MKPGQKVRLNKKAYLRPGYPDLLPGTIGEIVAPFHDDNSSYITKFYGIEYIFHKSYLDAIDGSTIEHDAVTPEHYHAGGVDVFTFAEANDELAGLIGYHRWSAVKYISRAGKKEGNSTLQDIKKAQKHLETLKELLEREGN